MPIQTDSLNRKLYELLKSQGYNPVPKDSEGQTTPVPDEAEVFQLTFNADGNDYGKVWITIDSSQNLIIYYDDNVTTSDDDTGGRNWSRFLQQMKNWAQRRQLSFELKNQNHLSSDMAQRSHMKKKEQIAEGYYPMGKSASYSDAVPTVKIVLQHTRQIQEGEQRYRNVARIFLENQQGERILAPTTRPGIAQVYARHLAEGGLPHDDRWNHIGSLVEEYSKMAGFVRATRGGQFNESAQQLVNEGVNHYNSLRETLGKMRGHRGYQSYFESYTPPLMEDDSDDNTINELFVQETLDPRIESVMPILAKLHKKVNEMSEVKELDEWATSLTEINLEEEVGDVRDAEDFKERIKNIKKMQMTQRADPTRNLAKLKQELIKKAKAKGIDTSSEELEEDLGPEQKKVGQLGPTEKVKNNNIGKLVGANESIEQGVAEGSEQTEETAVINMFEKLVKQGRDPIDMIAHKFGWGSYELDQLAKNLGFKNSAEWARAARRDEGVNKGVAEGSNKLKGTPVVSLSDFDDKDNKKNKYGQTVPKKLKKDDPRVKFHKDEKKGVNEGGYQQSPEELNKIAQGWAQKHPNIAQELAQAQAEFDRRHKGYEYASGARYADGKDAAAHLARLKSIKQIIDKGRESEGSTGLSEGHEDLEAIKRLLGK